MKGRKQLEKENLISVRGQFLDSKTKMRRTALVIDLILNGYIN